MNAQSQITAVKKQADSMVHLHAMLSIAPPEYFFNDIYLGEIDGGCVSVESYYDPDHVLSVSVMSEGDAIWASLIEGDSQCGRFVAANAVPQQVVEISQAVYKEWEAHGSLQGG